MSAIKEFEWLEVSDEQKSRVVQELKDWHQAAILDLATVIKGQHEGLFDNGWHEIWCSDCDKSSESFQGSILDAAAQFLADGWAVDSVERYTAVCRPCANKPDTSTYASQYEDERGLLG